VEDEAFPVVVIARARFEATRERENDGRDRARMARQCASRAMMTTRAPRAPRARTRVDANERTASRRAVTVARARASSREPVTMTRRDRDRETMGVALPSLPRRAALAALVASASACALPTPARAFTRPPRGFTRYNDPIDGYAFDRPEEWIEVKGSGNDVFFRDPGEVETNCFVSVSSPSSSTYASVEDLGGPEDAGKRVLEQYLSELMSTRLGVRRESQIVRAEKRVDVDGKVVYDLEMRISSYSARNQYGLTAEDRPQTLEWDRTLRSALGTENGKLYELRMQSPTESYQRNEGKFDAMVKSFRQFEADTPSVRSGFGL
tara:strand:- start:2683 stop:3648 length:966 start_codon:yes stop_codon:yes gene_type:complete